jgi:DNA replication protein DnaC
LLQQFQTLGDPDLVAMKAAALDFCADIQARKPARWLTLVGPSGTGKSMLAYLITRFVAEQACWFKIQGPGGDVPMKHQHYFASWPVMTEEVKDGDFGTVKLLCESEEKWNGKRGATYWFAVIDDIGQIEDASKPYLLSSLARIAEGRMGEWTVWTSNRSLAQIADTLNERIASRMIRGKNVVVENRCPDFNLR